MKILIPLLFMLNFQYRGAALANDFIHSSVTFIGTSILTVKTDLIFRFGG